MSTLSSPSTDDSVELLLADVRRTIAENRVFLDMLRGEGSSGVEEQEDGADQGTDPEEYEEL